MKAKVFVVSIMCVVLSIAAIAFAAYHHEGENDSDKFLAVYPDKVGTKLDHCALCHSGGSYINKKGKEVFLGSCQWCHDTYGYDGSGNILDTMNPYGTDYHDNGRNAQAITAIKHLDSDGDGFTNQEEINATRYPGDANDDPSKVVAPYRIYTKAQLEAMNQHTQFLLMNTDRSGDSYDEYTGVPMKDLLDDAGIDLDEAVGILVYSVDGWAQTHPLAFDANIEMYHVYYNFPDEEYQYPSASYYYDLEADVDQNPDYGWCDYSAPSCGGRSHGDPIYVEGGLKAILATKHNGTPLIPGILNVENKLDGEGPFRVVVPQKYVNAPDQSSMSAVQEVIWPYNEEWDHNAGSCSKSATVIKVEPLPEGTTDIDILEAGWAYVDQEKIVVYGAIDGTDSNGNGILDSEECTDPPSDYDGDGTPDCQDKDTAKPRHPNGLEQLLLHTSKGEFTAVETLSSDDPKLPQAGKPTMPFPYGAVKFSITGLNPGDSVTLTLVFPGDVPTTAKYYKISGANGWVEIPFGSNDGDNTITITLTDGDAQTDTDGLQNGTIVDPGALAIPSLTPTTSTSGGGGGCFIETCVKRLRALPAWVAVLFFGCALVCFASLRRSKKA
jgi:cytochrome c5